MLTRAIVRPPAVNFEQGLTSVDLGKPDFAKATAQHAGYCDALRKCGLALTWLEADSNFPDSTFVEDTAIVTAQSAVLTRPGATSRMGEVVAIEPALRRFYSRVDAIESPGTLDGGDVCAAGTHYFIGISERTNQRGADRLATFLDREGFTSSTVDIRGIGGILHLKSGVSYLGGRRLTLIDELIGHPAFAEYEVVRIPEAESYAANMLHINEHVIMSSGYPQVESSLRNLGYDPITVEMSEFRKMDGALSCLSLRF
ncbi:MAG: hypothetical protein WBV39_13375 [Rudaea sp.]